MNRFNHTFESLGEDQESWYTEWETGRRYRSHQGLQYWECGVVETITSFDGDPDLRKNLARTSMLEAYSSNGSIPYGFITSDGGVKIPKAWIAESCMLLVDNFAGLVVNNSRWGGLKWLSPTSFPVIGKQLLISIPDKDAEKAMWKEIFEERWNEAQVLKALDQVPHEEDGWETDTRSLASCIIDPQCRYSYVMRRFSEQTKAAYVEKYIRPKTSVIHKFDFLRLA